MSPTTRTPRKQVATSTITHLLSSRSIPRSMQTSKTRTLGIYRQFRRGGGSLSSTPANASRRSVAKLSLAAGVLFVGLVVTLSPTSVAGAAETVCHKYVDVDDYSISHGGSGPIPNLTLTLTSGEGVLTVTYNQETSISDFDQFNPYVQQDGNSVGGYFIDVNPGDGTYVS